MIRSLRVRHRRIFALLAVALPLLFAAALSVRRPIPRMQQLPPMLVPSVADELTVGGPRVVSWAGGSLRATRLTHESGPAVSIELLQELTRPGLLVYWTADALGDAEPLPAGAALLGSLSGRFPVAFPLPEEADVRDGRLILTSPTQDEVVASFLLPAAGPADEGSQR